MGMVGRLFLFFVSFTWVGACSRSVQSCGGPEPDYHRLLTIRRGIGLKTDGPKAHLLLPNPIDAAQDPMARIGDRRLLALESSVPLLGLLNPSRLESAFVKMRIRAIADELSTLAKPDKNGAYNDPPESDHYSEALGFYSLSVIQEYIEALGFTLNKDRPLYAMVMADFGDGSNEVNALYDHNRFNASEPRTIRFFGDTPYKVAKDRDMFWHEFGHFINESISQDRAMDLAGDTGADFTEGAALHECLADYGAESLAGTPYIGRWIARNFPEYRPGQPLRSAVDDSSSILQFQRVITEEPERYAVAQWCSRVLWQIREQFVQQDLERGVIDADRLIYSAVSLLQQDASIGQFREALLVADESLQCGVHQRSIETAFADRGFDPSPNRLATPLKLTARPVAAKSQNDGTREVTFELVISNSTNVTARNVRVFLESRDKRLIPLIYMQGYGDLMPGTVRAISPKGPFLSVSGVVVAARETRVPFRIRVMAENAEDSFFDGEIQP